MANICTFGIEVNGDPLRLRALQQVIERGVEELENPQEERYVLNIDRLFDDLQDGDHDIIWLDDSTPNPTDTFIGPEGPFWFSPDHRTLFLHGTSMHAPPVPLAERLSLAYPDLAFSVGGTTEHEMSEKWTCEAGISKCEWHVVRNLQNDQEMWYVRDGQPVPRPEWTATDQVAVTGGQGA